MALLFKTQQLDNRENFWLNCSNKKTNLKNILSSLNGRFTKLSNKDASKILYSYKNFNKKEVVSKKR